MGELAGTAHPRLVFPAATDDFTYTLNGGSTATVAITVTCPSGAALPSLPSPRVAKRCKKGFKKVRGNCRRKKAACCRRRARGDFRRSRLF